MNRFYRFCLVAMLCLTVWLCVKEICRTSAAIEMMRCGLKFTPVKK